ncbi:MAG: hypothetical protein L0323_01725 [Planctomycetes bacterium]|nr:hypothetical protein [Planctomycetota bacterium]
MILDALLRGVLVPALVAGVLLILIDRLPGREGGRGARNWLGAIPLAAGYASTQVALVGWPAFPPRESTHGLFYIAIAAALLSPLATARGIRAPLRWIATAVLAFGVPVLLLRSRIVQRWSAGESLLVVGALGSSLLAVGGAAGTAARLPGPLSYVVLLIPLGSAAGVLGLSGTALHAQLAGAVASGLGAGFVISLTRGGAPASPAMARFSSILLASVLITGHFYARVSVASALLIALCPIATACTEGLERGRSLSMWQRTLIHILGPGILGGTSLGLAVRAFLASDAAGF